MSTASEQRAGTTQAKMENRDIGQRILNLLSSRSRKQESPTKIANALRISKKALNVHMYKLQSAGKVMKVQETPPMWCLASEVVSVSTSEGAVASRPTRARGGPIPAHERIKVDEELVEKVLTYLQDKQTPAKALDIAKAVGLAKASDVNPTIYHLEKKNIVCKHSGKPPLWGLAHDDLDLNEPMDGESLDYNATLDSAAEPFICRPELFDDQVGTSGNLPVFQETELFQANAYDSDNSGTKDIEPLGDAELNMETESNSCDKSLDLDIVISDEGNKISEESNNDEEDPVKTSVDAEPKSFRDMFNLDDSVSNEESDEDMKEDIRETFMEAYRKQNKQDYDTNSLETAVCQPTEQDVSNNINMAAEACQGAESVSGDTSVPTEHDNETVAQSFTVGLNLDKTLDHEEFKDCLVVLTQLVAFPGMTNFVLKKKTLLSDEQLTRAMEKCLSLDYVSGSKKLWKITEAGKNLVNSHSGATGNAEEFVFAPVQKKSMLNSQGPPPTPMAILKSHGHQSVQEKSPSSASSSSSLKPTVRTESVSQPPPLMSLHLESIPLLNTSSTSNFTNTLSVGLVSQISQGFKGINAQNPTTLLHQSISGSNTNKSSSSALWDDFQNEGKQISNVTAHSSIQGSSLIPQTLNFKQRQLPSFKMKASDQAPPKLEISADLLNYPNQKTSHQVLKDIQRPSRNGAPCETSKSAFNKGPPPTPLELLTKGLKKTEISPPKNSEPPRTIYQQSMTMSAITNTSTFSRPDPPRKFIGTGSLLPQSQSRQEWNQPASLQTGLPSSKGFGGDSGGFRSLPPSGRPLVNTGAVGNSLALSTESFAALNKNPVSALMEYAQSRKLVARIEVVGRKGTAHRPTFEMAVFVGNRKFPSITCHNKKDGRKEASDIAMRQLIAEGQFQCNTSATEAGMSKPMVPSGNMTHFDKIAALTHRGFTALVSQITVESFAGRKVIAGLVMKRSDADNGVLISLGTGNRCITGQQLSLQGNTINDSHAEIITRRGFIRFLYKQLMEYDPSKSSPLFERSSSGKLRVKSNISFHLYISTAPCGDGALFSPRDAEAMKVPLDTRIRPPHNPTFSSAVQGLLRTKVEGGEGTIPIEPDFTIQTFDGIQRGERLRTMSCTDKICRWNVVGLQGALLSQFLDPVYLDTLTLGLLFDQGHLSRAVCCRVAYGPTDVDELLPHGYKLNHPWLGRVTSCDPPREVQKTKALSVNWSFGDNGLEVTDGTKGLCYTNIEKGFFSRCSKRNLFNSYKALCEKFGRRDLLQVTNYNEAKRKATEFNTAKKAMLEKFRENKLGKWVSKPVEEEMFGFEET